MAEDRLGPIFLGDRLDVLFAHLMAHISARTHQGKARKAYRLRDHLIQWWRPVAPRRTGALRRAEVQEKLLAFFAAHNAAVARLEAAKKLAGSGDGGDPQHHRRGHR